VSIFLHFHASLPLIEEVYPLPFPPFSFQTLFFLLFKDDCINSLGAEFIISSKLWEDIGSLLYKSLYLAYEFGSFTDFQYQGVITCIPKEGKDRRFIGNWRPISLLNTDLKIASAVIKQLHTNYKQIR
jgi:hypothetical protein